MKTSLNLFSDIEILETIGELPPQISSICFDSRLAEKKSIFVAVKGTKTDGHVFIDKALGRGAAVVVYEKGVPNKLPGAAYIRVRDSHAALAKLAQNFYDHPSRKLKLIGVTGTNGKTTTATLLFKLFERLGHKSALLSTIENKIDDKIFPATLTTPDPIAIASFLDQAVRNSCQYAFMECSSHAIDQKRITGLEFAGAIFTNLTHDHLDYHKTMTAYASSKKALFDVLLAHSFAVANADDEQSAYILSDTVAEKHFFSLKDADITQTEEGLAINYDEKIIRTKLFGKFNAYNIIGIYTVAKVLGMNENEILSGIVRLEAPAGRLEFIKSKNGIRGVVDYAHTPDALENVLKTLRKVAGSGVKLITVVGCGGDRDTSKRPIMAGIACKLSDYTVFTSDNPRSENPDKIIDDMIVGVAGLTDKYECVPDRAGAIATAVELSKPGDIILLAGKGHEDYQILKGGKIHFSDKEELRKIFDKTA